MLFINHKNNPLIKDHLYVNETIIDIDSNITTVQSVRSYIAFCKKYYSPLPHRKFHLLS